MGLTDEYKREKEAEEAGREGVKIVAEEFKKSLGEEPSGRYLDLKNGGVMRPWKNNS